MHFERQLRLRVLEALELAAKQFRTREELFPIRIPREPIRLDDVIERALGDDSARFDPSIAPRAHDPPPRVGRWQRVGRVGHHAAVAAAALLRLGRTTKPACSRPGGRNAGDETDRQFLTLLSESAGETFGIEMAGGAPTRVRSSIADRAFLVDVFVNLFEVRAMEGTIRADLDERRADASPGDLLAETVDGTDFRVDVERWLELVAR